MTALHQTQSDTSAFGCHLSNIDHDYVKYVSRPECERKDSSRDNTNTESRAQRKLLAAVTSGSVAQIGHLVNARTINKLDLGIRDENGATCLDIAARSGDLEIVQQLIKAGCEVNSADFYGQTALQYAVSRGHRDIVKLLIDYGANVDWQDEHNDGLSSLHMAACKGHVEVTKLLIKAGCDVNATDIHGVSVLHCAVANNHEDVVKALLEGRARGHQFGLRTHRSPIFLAVGLENATMTRMLLQHGARINHRDGFGLTPLGMACLQNSTEIAELLIKAGAKPNIGDKRNNLPLHYAARNGNLHLVQLLHEHGFVSDAISPRIFINSTFDTTFPELSGSKFDVLSTYYRHAQGPLHLAIQRGHLHIAKYLTEKGCDVDLALPSGRCSNYTPLHMALDNYSTRDLFEAVLKLLLTGRCNLDSQAFPTLEAPLYRAVDQGLQDAACILLQYGSNPSLCTAHDISVLQRVCQKGLIHLVPLLLESGLDWSCEKAWLDTDIHTCGINPKLLQGYDENIPLCLTHDPDLYFTLQTARYNAQSLCSLARLAIRRVLGSGLWVSLTLLGLPQPLQKYLMLNG